MKMTLLQIVQNILSSMDSDEVNSIFDTTESIQVAEVVRETFYEQFNNIEIPEFRTLLKLTSVSDPVNRPNYLMLPTNVKKIEWIKYRNFRNHEVFEDVKFLSPEDFFKRLLPMRADSPNARLITDFSGVQYYITNNSVPNYYTSVDDKYVIFDSFDEEAEASMQNYNSFSWGTMDFQFMMEDTYIPPLDANLFPLLLAEAKDTCFINFKQISNAKEQVKARRQRIRMQNDQYRDRQAQYKAQKEWDYSRKRP